MRENIVFATGMGRASVLRDDSLFWVSLEPGWAPEAFPPGAGKPANGLIQSTGAACSVFFLRYQAGWREGEAAPADTALVYWVRYKENNHTFTTIGTRSRTIFTAKMDGCSFGLGSVNPDGSCIAGHANRVSVGRAEGFQAQSASQSADLAGQGMNLQINPSTYRSARMDEHGVQVGWTDQGTTFGLRSDMAWKIYTQRIGGTQPNFVHKGLVTGINAQF